MTKNFNRVAYVQIAIGDPSRLSTSEESEAMYKELDWETIRGLDVKFDITLPIYATLAEARISILGLSMQRIERYATWGAEATAWKKLVFIRLYAGYGTESDAKLIFEGNVITAMPTTPPDIWLEIQARTLFFMNGLVLTEQLSEPTDVPDTMKLGEYVKLVCDSIGAVCDMGSVDDDTLSKEITTPQYQTPESATAMNILKDMRKLCEANGMLFFIRYSNDGKPAIVFEPIRRPSNFTPSQGTIIRINKNNGMIGIPKMKFNQIEVTCLLNESATNKLLMYVDVTSRFALPGMFDNYGNATNDLYRALYRIINIRFHGHLRGNEWYATYTAMKDWRKGE